jgi:hypothetical protein
MRQRKTSLAPGYLVTNVPVSLPLKSPLLSRYLLILKSQCWIRTFPQGFPTGSINERFAVAPLTEIEVEQRRLADYDTALDVAELDGELAS